MDGNSDGGEMWAPGMDEISDGGETKLKCIDFSQKPTRLFDPIHVFGSQILVITVRSRYVSDALWPDPGFLWKP